MPPKERKNKTPPGRNPSPPNQALNWQQIQTVESANAPGSTLSPLMAAALEECEIKFVMNLPEIELQSPERLFMNIEQAHWFYEDYIVDAPGSNLKSMALKDFALKLFQYSELLQPQVSMFEASFKAWNAYKFSIPTYGCIMLNEQLNQMVLVCNWKGTSWGFPKGKLNENEDGATCAAREVQEETGYLPTGLSEEDSYTVVDEGGQRCKMFYHRGVPLDYPFAPLARKEISRVEFFPFDAAPKRSWKVDCFLPHLKRWCKQQRRKPKPAALAAAAAAHAAAAATTATASAASSSSSGDHSKKLPREASQTTNALRGGGEAAANSAGRTTAHSSSSNNGYSSNSSSSSSSIASAPAKWQFARGKPFTFDLADIMSVIPTP